MDKFTFAEIDVQVTNKEKLAMLAEVRNLSNNVHHWNKFRGCRMIAIYNGGSRLGGRVEGIDTKEGNFGYTEAGQQCPTIQKVCEQNIFPFMNPPGRVTILRTDPNTGLNIHLDSAEREIGTLQYKYRLVLNGNIGKLYFIDENYNKVYVSPNYNSYVMDGSHAHSIDPDVEEKITLCIGAPWHGETNTFYSKKLEDSKYKITVSRPETKQEWLDPAFN